MIYFIRFFFDQTSVDYKELLEYTETLLKNCDNTLPDRPEAPSVSSIFPCVVCVGEGSAFL